MCQNFCQTGALALSFSTHELLAKNKMTVTLRLAYSPDLGLHYFFLLAAVKMAAS
jgi:hypothetical protein